METVLFKLGRYSDRFTEQPKVVCLSFHRRYIPNALQQAVVVEPLHPLQDGELHGLFGLPRCATVYQLGLVQPVIVSARALS